MNLSSQANPNLASIRVDTLVGNPPSGWKGDYYPYHNAQSFSNFFQINPAGKYFFDELHPDKYPWHTRAAFRDYCIAAADTPPKIFAVALDDDAFNVSLGLEDAQVQLNRSITNIKLAPECYIYAELTHPCWIPAYTFLQKYIARLITLSLPAHQKLTANQLVPLFNVSNSGWKPELYARAYSTNPGQVSQGWWTLFREMKQYSIWNAGTWGETYLGINEGDPTTQPLTRRGAAMTAWDQELQLAFRMP